MPFGAHVFPVVVPFHFFARAHKKLHFHLFKFAHAEDELTCYNFISEGFANLCNPKRDFHAARFLDIQEVDEDTLRSFWAQINGTGVTSHRTEFCREHEVKLAHFGPVFRTRNRANDFEVDDELAYTFEVVLFECAFHALFYLCDFLLIAQHIRVCSSKLCSIKSIAKALESFFDFFFNLLTDLFDVVF